MGTGWYAREPVLIQSGIVGSCGLFTRNDTPVHNCGQRKGEDFSAFTSFRNDGNASTRITG